MFSLILVFQLLGKIETYQERYDSYDLCMSHSMAISDNIKLQGGRVFAADCVRLKQF